MRGTGSEATDQATDGTTDRVTGVGGDRATAVVTDREAEDVVDGGTAGTEVAPDARGWISRLSTGLDPARAPARDRLWGWLAPLLVAVVGGVMRFVNLGEPRKLVFDETYYVKEAGSFLKYGVEMAIKVSIDANEKTRNASADKLWNAGNHDVWGSDPGFVVHPPVGRWMIAFGEWLFGGTNTFGWRFSAAVCGTLSIFMIGRIARRLFRSTLLGGVAALLLAMDGQELVHSRTSILDIFVMFWALAAFGCLLVDRDAARRRLAVAAEGVAPATGVLRRFGPWSGVRWWRIAGIVCLALCTGVKWSGLYFTAVFLVLSVFWDVSARRALGVRRWFWGGVLRDGAQALATTIVVLPTVYVSSWVGWFHSDKGWDRHWAESNPATGVWTHVPDALRSLLHYHAEMWTSASGITTPHDWQANPWAWLVQGRPTLFLNDPYTRGQSGCDAASCNAMVTDLGNPLIWWAGTLAVFVLVFRWVLARDWRAGAALAGFIGGYLPWFQYQKRTIFEFYAVAFLPWVVLGVVYCLGLMLGPPGRDPLDHRPRRIVAVTYVIAVVMAMWFFFPIVAGQVVPAGELPLRRWLASWY